MKLNHLLEDAAQDDPRQKLRQLALELQSYLLDLEHIELDVELLNEDGAIVLEYHDKNRLVRGKLMLSYTKDFYRAWTQDSGVLYARRELPLNTGGLILFKLFKDDLPFKAFEQSVMTAFGTASITTEDKVRLAKDEVFGINVTPPFKLEHGLKRAPMMVHNQKIIQLLTVCITSRSTVRVNAHDSNGDVTAFEGDTIESTFPKLQEFITAALEAL